METNRVLFRNTKQVAKDNGLFVTLFADASWCPKTMASGFAGWVKHGLHGETVRCVGTMGLQDKPTTAELMAIRHTIVHMVEKGVELKDKVLVIQSDCLSALHQIEKDIKRIQDPIMEAVRTTKYIKYKHVRGHQGTKDKRSSVNTWCDKEARKAMRSMRDKIATN